MGSTSYSIYETKTHLSKIIREVKRNRRVTITERGTPVAVVVPYVADTAVTITQRIAELKERGVLVNPKVDHHSIVPLRRAAGALRRFLRDRS